MSEHICRYGTDKKTAPVESYAELLDQESEYRDDDGTRVDLICDSCDSLSDSHEPHENCDRAVPVCVDRGVGRLMWAEGGYVPWHRICTHCGSHWDLHPGKEGYYQRARFYT